MKRVFALITICAVFCAASSQCMGQSIQKVSDKAKIDWTNLVYIAEGHGAMPSAKEEPNRGRARLKARDYARMDALANLLMAIEGTTISYESVGRDYMADTVIRQTIQGFVKNAEVTKVYDQKVEGDTIVIVQVKAPMFSNGGPGSVFLREMTQPDPAAASDVKVVVKPDKPARITSTIKPAPSKAVKPYTGLIIDATGYQLDRCMSPKIRRQDGSEVWGTVNANHDMLIERGIVSYATSLAEAKKNPRVGANPLVLRACGRAGGRFYSDPVIKAEDADLLLAENAKSSFLDRFSVVFVKDPAL